MPDTQSLSERIIDVLLCRLRGIRQADGYRTDAGLRVFHARRTVDDLPAIVLWDDGENPAAATGDTLSFLNALTLTIEGHVACDQDDTGTALQTIKADVKKAVMQLRGAVMDDAGAIGALALQAIKTAPRADGDTSESVQLSFVVNFKEGYGNPYAAK